MSFLAVATLLLAGCPKGNQYAKQGHRAELIGDYDTALVAYDKALRADPLNTEYKLRDIRVHFEDGQFHVEQGQKALKRNELELALSEFRKAAAIDPSSPIATQEAQKTMELLARVKAAEAPKPVGVVPPETTGLMSAPPELKPLSRAPFNLRMTNDARVVFQTIGQIAGVSVIFDPSFVSRRIPVDLSNVTVEQALDVVSLETNTFWKPVTSNIILVAPDSPAKRRELEDEEVQTFYLRNNVTPQELTEVVNGLRQLLDITRILQVNSDNAVVIRATPDKLMLASRVIRDLDKAKPEVVIQVDVLEARLDREHALGIQPGTSASLTFNPRTSVQPNGGTSSSSSSSSTSGSSTSNQITLNNLKHLSTADYALTLPGATLTALLNDTTTRIIQDPSIRVTDGSTAKLEIGDRVPIATGSFQAGVGAGTTGVSPLVNTQFQYIPVGVNIEVTPRIHPDGDVSLKLSVEVSSVTGESNIGGIQQPIISTRKIGPDNFRLKDGQVSILGGLITRSQSKALSGWPGVAHIPFLRYFFSSQDNHIQDDEVLIALTPQVVRMPSITSNDLRTIAAGTETNVRVYRKDVDALPVVSPSAKKSPATARASQSAGQPPAGGTSLQFAPASVSMKPGDTATIGLSVENAKDLFSIPLLLKYDPSVIQIEDIRNGGFLSGGTQEIAVVQQVNQQQGQAIVSATRRPNTPGISGTGTLLGIVIKALAPGTSQLQIVQVNARNSQQKPIAISVGSATIQVKQ